MARTVVMRRAMRISALAALAAASALLVDTPAARACGWLSSPMPPPVPPVGEVTYTVNQQSEQIIFEAEPGWVTAHVMIRYAGDPAQFAWLVPVPEVPELAIDPPTAFGLLDAYTKPTINLSTENICPQSQWACEYHAPLYCGPGGADYGAAALDASLGLADGAPGGGSGTGVTVSSEQTVGDYQTVIFKATEASLATQWRKDNGFIVNNTTSIYMESYVAAGMVFVAAKLVPGAGVSSIEPLRMKCRAAAANGPACACEEGFVALQYTDLDSQQSVTCVPATPPVDLRAGGAQIPDACATTDCGTGSCVDRTGIATCVCPANTAASVRIAGTHPFCSQPLSPTGGPGAQDYSGPLRALAVCAPRYPSCGTGGWLAKEPVQSAGVDCGDATPAY